MEVFKLFGTISINKAGALADLKSVEAAASTSSGKIGAAFKSIGDKAAKFIKLGAVAAVAGLTAAMVKGVQAAAGYEQAMIELAKVTDPDTAGSVGAAIREMAKDMPIAHEALMGIAADAGRLGVEGVDNILLFTKTVAQISVATDIMAEDAGTDFAKLITLLGEDIDVIDELGSAINELSNNMAVSSSEIVDSMLRSSASLAGLDMGTAEIVALNAAMNEVVFSARLAGTALKTIAQALQNPEKMVDLADALGITVDEFRALRQEDPVELFKQLALMMDEGGVKAEELVGILGDSASKLQALATNWDGVEEAIASANTQMAEATSLQREYDLAVEGFNSQMTILKNNFHDIMIEVGNALMPTLNDFMDWVKNNTEPIEEMLLGVANGLISSFGWIVEHREGIATALKVIGAGIAGLGLASLIMNLNPISLIITAIAASIAALLIYWDDVVQFFKDIGSAVSGWVSGAWNAVKGFFGVGEKAAGEMARGIASGKVAVQAAVQDLMTPEEAQAWGESIGGSFSTGMQQGIDTGGLTIGGDATPSAPLGSFGGEVDAFVPPDVDGTVSAWQNMWDRIRDTFGEFKDDIKVAWDETKTIIGDSVGVIFHDTVATWWAQNAQHREAMNGIRDDTKDSLQEEKIAYDTAFAELKQRLDDELISQEEYNTQKQTMLEEYDAARQEISDGEKQRLDDEEAAFEEQKKSIWEILKESVRNVLKALKEELLLKAAAALAEAIAMTLGLNPMAISKYAEAGAYALGAGGLAIAGFEKGAVFNKPTMLPPHMVAEAGKPEAYLPLSRDVFSKIGAGIVNALVPQTPQLAGAVNIDMRGLYEGASFSVRSDQDIKDIAFQSHELMKTELAGRGHKL